MGAGGRKPGVPTGRPCKAHTTAGNPCKNAAIRGGTVCLAHGGRAPRVKAKAAIRAHLEDWGFGDTTVDPGEMLLRMLTQSASRAERYAAELEALVAEAEANGTPLRDALIREAYGEFGPTGEYARGLVELEHRERVFCRDTAVKGIAAGLAKRQTELAERQGAQIAKVLAAVFDELVLTEEQREAAPDVIRHHLRLIAS